MIKKTKKNIAVEKKVKKTIDILTDNSYSLMVIGERGCGNC